jgi:TonB family protein
MLKTTLVKPLQFPIVLICFAAFCLVLFPAIAQDSPTAKEPPSAMPTDPKELMHLAAKSNGLNGDDVQPWHLKVTYKQIGEDGNTTDEGAYEEFWASPTKFKRTYSGKAFEYTEYDTTKGLLFSGDQSTQFRLADELRREFVDPMQGSRAAESQGLIIKQRDAGAVKLGCLSMKDALGNPFGEVWCLDADKPILRIKASPQGVRVGYNRILNFNGRFIAGDLEFVRQGKQYLTAHIESIETIAALDDATFLPPADAAPLKQKIVTIAGGVAQGFLIKRVQPDYPMLAQERGIMGTVILQAIIGKDGHLRDLRVVSGPPELRQAATDAVKKWVYRPYLLNGEVVEVVTTINVAFNLGRR